ncbi:MAG: Asp23/Gls24 family envelope stress response protein [Eubacteriales bacterium]|nr:Asp23/Gls24 family envelope stress response protein [Eubacteriales bacterium]
MVKKKENLPIHSEDTNTDGGTITYAPEVIAIIAGVAANEIEGLAGMCTSGGFADIMNKNKNITRGVKVELGTEEVSVELYTIIEYGQPIQKVALEVQENVRKNIEAMTGLHVVRVDVFVQGVSFEKEKREVQQSLDSAKVPSLLERNKDSEPKKTEDLEPTDDLNTDDEPIEPAQESTTDSED